MERVYLLRGFSGEYSDRSDWVVACYLDRAEAESHLERLLELLGPPMTPLEYDEREELQARIHASGLDNSCQIQYTGSRYGIQAIPLSIFAPGRPQPPRRSSALSA